SPTPVILEGSRGTGKSFLLRVAEAQLLEKLSVDRVVPVYLSFITSSLVQTADPKQFQHWMMAKLCARVIRALYQSGLLVKTDSAVSILTGGTTSLPVTETPLERVTRSYEDSYKNPGMSIDAS